MFVTMIIVTAFYLCLIPHCHYIVAGKLHLFLQWSEYIAQHGDTFGKACGIGVALQAKTERG